MDFPANFPLFSIILSLLAAVVCIFLRGKAARNFTLALRGVCLLLSLGTLIYLLTEKDGGAVTYMMGHFPAPWGNEIRFGPLETLLATVFDGVIFLSLLGGWRYVERDVAEGKRGSYCLLFHLIGAAMLAMIYTNDLFTGYVFLEILTLSACGILIVRGIGRTTLAAVRYMIMNLLGSGLFLLGVILTYSVTGNLLMVSIRERVDAFHAAGNDPFPLAVATILMCIGLGLKSGLFPFHFWMPDTYGYATPASSCLLSGVVSKGYIFLLIKILVRVLGEGTPAVVSARHILLLLGLCGILFGSVSAISQKRIDRMIAYSSAAQIGYIYVGIGLGGTLGYTAAIFHILVHTLTKPALFLSAGRLREAAGGAEFRALRGAGRREPLAALVFTGGAFSMVGVPVFAGFFSKILFGRAALAHSGFVAVTVLAVVALSTVLNVVYFFHTVMTLYTPEDAPTSLDGSALLFLLRSRGEQDGSGPTRAERAAFAVSGVALTACNLLLGVLAGVIIPFIERGLAVL